MPKGNGLKRINQLNSYRNKKANKTVGFEVDFGGGTIISYRDRGNGIVTRINDVVPLNVNGLTFSQLFAKVKANSTLTVSRIYTAADLKTIDAQNAQNRVAMNQQLNLSYAQPNGSGKSGRAAARFNRNVARTRRKSK